MNIPCSFCGRNSTFEVLIFKLQEPSTKLGKHVSGEGHRAGLFAKLFLCEKCLPFKRILEINEERTVEVKTIKEIKNG